ncbi:MAG: methionyl-tRNA formyltransferase [Patescibacteria group bacterium]
MNTSHTYRVVFMGTPEAAVPSLKTLLNDVQFEVVAVVTQTDKPVGRKQIVTPSPIKVLAEENGIPVLQPVKLKNNPVLWEQLRGLSPDVMVVVVYGKILPQEVLDIPAHGIVNVHPSFLPKYRGTSPVVNAILNGDKETGVTIMKLELEMDSGPIIAKSQPMIISPTDTTATLAAKLAEVGAKVLIESLPKYLNGEITPTPQNEAGATYVKIIQKEDGLIDWHDDEEIIARQVRAYTPWPSAYTNLNGQPIKILSAEFNPTVENPKGTIAKIDGRLYIGKLKINQLQLAGKKPMDGKSFLAGYPQMVGTRLI